jgi:anti-sigma-K factor RskA
VKIQGKTELQERLAAEYALGTLRGAARRRLQRWMREDAALAMAVTRWEARLAPMAGAVAPVRPPARVWRAIQQQTGAQAAARGWWESIAFWRNLGLAASGMTAALLVATILISRPPQQAAPSPVVLRVPSEHIPASYLAVLSEPKTQKAVLVAWAGQKSDKLWVTTLDPAIHVPEKSLELWALPKTGAPKSLGLVAEGQKGVLQLAAIADQSLGEIPALAVSLEPKGGSPTGAPTGPVLFTGPCVKYW